ncbi:hypothetical protein LTR37_004321 [Vermiconidia calcicola]|uniref:Uncharacterized protein n=1 Tax=Vermiconidia calcicola TaxID=1690605 RepID=A0ACC3NMK1_9PEZI|nr:hypothetical protein LTR37_004321 [Vermiconidia calcicola]
MDLAALMNDGNAGEKDKKQSPGAQRTSQPAPPVGANGQPPTPIHAAHPHRPTAQYGPPPIGAARSYGSQGLTPLQTATQAPVGGHYGAFPPPQSPAGAQPYRSHEGFPATTPGSRGLSSGYHYPQASHSQHVPSNGVQQGFHAHPNASLSPTPSSHHSQTPHSVRQSPLASMSHAPHTQFHTHQYQQQHSQPSTPLGPPPLHYQRSSNPAELVSPYHQRTFSGASNGFLSGSPAQHHPSIGNIMESPNAYHRPSPHQRRTSEYVERERSVSVSPKTQVPPRLPSLGSRQSSLQEAYSSNRSSMQQSATATLSASSSSQGHVTQPQHQFPAAPQAFNQPPNPANGVAQVTPSSLRGVQPNSFNSGSSPAEAGSLSSFGNGERAPPAPAIHHQNQKMGMNHLLTPANKVPPALNGNNMKRAAEEPPSSQPPAKQRKPLRKYTSQPPWAKLSKHNPRYQQQEQSNGMDTGSNHHAKSGSGLRPDRQPSSNGREQADTTRHAQPQMPAQSHGTQGTGPQPWLQNPPLDHDLIQGRRILGNWEKTFRWNTPYPDQLRVVQDWLFGELSRLGDVGSDPQTGTVEVEAKIGTLLKHDPTERCQLPVMNMSIIDPRANNRYSFESQMTEAEHQAMNNFLNDTIQKTQQPGRSVMRYKHIFEQDSFHALSPYGLSMLPESLKRRRNNREPRLRITTDTKTGKIVARIVKINVSQLHIFNPLYNYDCRISINIEVNLDRPDIDPASLVAEQAVAVKELDRKKDRLSYKHLAYSIDLTRVDREGHKPSYELEVEVDSNLLRQQMQLLQGGQESAFGDVVSGFLDNTTFLMRQGLPASG